MFLGSHVQTHSDGGFRPNDDEPGSSLGAAAVTVTVWANIRGQMCSKVLGYEYIYFTGPCSSFYTELLAMEMAFNLLKEIFQRTRNHTFRQLCYRYERGVQIDLDGAITPD